MKIEHYDIRNKHRLIPTYMRGAVKAGEPPLYALNAPDYDRVPIDTFLIETQTASIGRIPTDVHRVVKPNDPTKYPMGKLTPGKRLLYTCWSARLLRGPDGTACHKGFAARLLGNPVRNSYRHVVFPGEPAHEMIAAFKVACDTVRAWKGHAAPMEPTLLCRALGIEQFDLSL